MTLRTFIEQAMAITGNDMNREMRFQVHVEIQVDSTDDNQRYRAALNYKDVEIHSNHPKELIIELS